MKQTHNFPLFFQHPFENIPFWVEKAVDKSVEKPVDKLGIAKEQERMSPPKRMKKGEQAKPD